MCVCVFSKCIDQYQKDNRNTQDEWIKCLKTLTPNGFNIKRNGTTMK